MNSLLNVSAEARLVIMFVMGVVVGTQVNRGIYRLAWFQRNIGPWSPPYPHAPPRNWYDRIPIVGWFFLRRESFIHGPGFWIRPMLIELAMGATFAGVYWYEVLHYGVAGFNPGAATLNVQCFTHLLLFSLTTIATFIDFDEQTIPDGITLLGTVLGLTIAALFPLSRALVAVPAPTGYVPDFLHVGSGTALPGSSGWPASLDGPLGLAVGIGCFVAWCVAMMPWTWTMRRGVTKAFQFFCASLQRRAATIPLAILAIVGSIAIACVWFIGGQRWESLLSSLVGMTVGGGMIWAVRIVGSHALGQEAMGFGDVTLMAMIGAFTGWQPTLIIFFLAPFSAIIIAVTQYVFTRRHDIAFGPYLCLSTVVWTLYSNQLWKDYGLPIFSLGWLVPAIGASGLLLMGGLLGLWRMIREAIALPDDERVITPAGGHPEGSSHAPDIDNTGPLMWSRRASVIRSHPLRAYFNLHPKSGPIPPPSPLSHRPLPPHAKSPYRG